MAVYNKALYGTAPSVKAALGTGHQMVYWGVQAYADTGSSLLKETDLNPCCEGSSPTPATPAADLQAVGDARNGRWLPENFLESK